MFGRVSIVGHDTTQKNKATCITWPFPLFSFNDDKIYFHPKKRERAPTGHRGSKIAGGLSVPLRGSFAFLTKRGSYTSPLNIG